MPSKNPAQRLRDIIDNIDAIEVFTAQLDFLAFRADRKTVYAVVRALEIVSEASRRLPDELTERHPANSGVPVHAAFLIFRSTRRPAAASKITRLSMENRWILPHTRSETLG